MKYDELKVGDIVKVDNISNGDKLIVIVIRLHNVDGIYHQVKPIHISECKYRDMEIGKPFHLNEHKDVKLTKITEEDAFIECL